LKKVVVAFFTWNNIMGGRQNNILIKYRSF